MGTPVRIKVKKPRSTVAQVAHHKKGGRARTGARMQAQRAKFLDALSEGAHVGDACKLASIPRRTVYHWKSTDPKFSEEWDAAFELGTDALEDEAVRRAFQGTEKPVFYKGAVCGYVREYSDTLLIFTLKARRPEKFKDRGELEHKGDVIKRFMEAVSGKSRGLPNRYQPKEGP